MYLRTKTVKSAGKSYDYLQLVESSREEGRVVQRVIASLGRVDKLRGEGALDRLALSMARFTEKVAVLDALAEGSVVADEVRQWGGPLVFDRLWRDLGVQRILRRLAGGRGFTFDVERFVFAMALQRLLRSRTGSDRDGWYWLDEVRIEGLTDVPEPAGLQHFYRSVRFLAENQAELERSLWDEGRDLFNRRVDVALFDTTTLYFEGEGPEELGARGKNKDGKYGNAQIVLGVVMTQDGWPLCMDTMPGNTADVSTVVPLLERLKKRFDLKSVVLVADRGMTSRANIEAIRAAGYDFVLGCKLRGDKTVRDEVLSRPGRYHPVADNIRVKQVRVDDRRYIVVHNPQQETKDRETREAIVERLREDLVGQTAKNAIPHRLYKRFLRVGDATLALDESAVEADARYDGKYVLETSTDWSAERVALAYRSLWMVERYFRDFKTPINARPIYHRDPQQVRGHLVGCFLGMYLAIGLRKQLEALGAEAEGVEWSRLMQDLGRVQAMRLKLDTREFLVRSELTGSAHLAFRAVGLKPPPRVQPIGTTAEV